MVTKVNENKKALARLKDAAKRVISLRLKIANKRKEKKMAPKAQRLLSEGVSEGPAPSSCHDFARRQKNTTFAVYNAR